MTVAEVLTAAADRLDAMLAEIAPGPWGVYDPNEGTGFAPLWSVANDAFHNPPTDDDISGFEAEVDCGGRSEAEWIATMDPIVGRALVALLRDVAGCMTVAGATDPGLEPLARAILGEAQS